METQEWYIVITTFILFHWDFLKHFFSSNLVIFHWEFFFPIKNLDPDTSKSLAPDSTSPDSKQRENTFFTGGIWEFFYVLYSTQLHLPPLRFHFVGGCWDRTQAVATSALAVRHSYHSARSHPQGANTYPDWACCPVSCRGRPVRQECWNPDRTRNRGRYKIIQRSSFLTYK
jgi:hypothetical protein